MRIGIDFDEVVADSVATIIKLHNEQYRTSFKREEVTKYHVDEVWGGTKEEWRQKLDEFFSTKNAKHLDPVAGSIPAMDALKRAGHELYVITARSDDDIEATELWLKMHFPKTFKNVHYGNSWYPEKKKLKSEMCKENGIEVMVDDRMSVAQDCGPAGIRVLLFDQPWNQGELPPNVERVFSWDEIVKKLS